MQNFKEALKLVQQAIQQGLINSTDKVETEIIDFSNFTRPYIVFAKSEEDLLEISKLLETETNNLENIPDKATEVFYAYENLNFAKVYYLSWIEAVKLRRDSRIKNVSLYNNPYIINAPAVVDNYNFWKDLGDDDFSNVKNWGLVRSINQQDPYHPTSGTILKNTDPGVTYTAQEKYDKVNLYKKPDYPKTGGKTTYEYIYQGEGVDLVIQDERVYHLHPEFLGADGISRFVCIDWYREASDGLFIQKQNGFVVSYETNDLSGISRVMTTTVPNGNWTAPFTFTIEAPWKSGGRRAAATPIIFADQTVSSYSHTVTDTGSGYAPEITLVGGGGIGATAIAAEWGNGVTRIIVTNPGTGYTSTPTVQIQGRGTNAAARTIVHNGQVVGIIVTQAGSGYAPTITYSGGTSVNNTITGVFTTSSSLLYRVSGGSQFPIYGLSPEKQYDYTYGVGSHGTHVASTAGGLLNGWAKKAKIYSAPMLAESSMNSYGGYNSIAISSNNTFILIKAWHKKKTLDSVLGTIRPTVVNGSWGSSNTLIPRRIYSTQNFNVNEDEIFEDSTTTHLWGFRVRGTNYYSPSFNYNYGISMFPANTITYDPADDSIETSYRLQNSGRKSELYIDPTGYNVGVNLAVDDFLTEVTGLYFVHAAGNYNLRLLKPTDLDYDNQILIYFTDENGNKVMFTELFSKEMHKRSPWSEKAITVGAASAYTAGMTTGVNSNKEKKSSFSNYGEAVDVFAPGTKIMAAVYSSPTKNYPYYNKNNQQTTFLNELYNGTSMASPQVAGVVCLTAERIAKKYNTLLTVEQMKSTFNNPANYTVNGETQFANNIAGVLYDPETKAGKFHSLGRASSGVIRNNYLYWPYSTEEGVAAPPPQTFSLSNNAPGGVINESQSVIFTLDTTNVPAGSLIGYNITGVTANDIDKPLIGSFTLVSTGGSSCRGTLTIAIKADQAKEGTEQLVLSLTDRNITSSVIINDTSTPPNTAYLLSASSSSVSEGSTLNIKLRTSIFNPPTAVFKVYDIPYGDSPRQTVDLYLPNGSVDAVVFYVHGGSWAGGSKNAMLSNAPGFVPGDPKFENLALAGLAVIAINYRLINITPEYGSVAADGVFPNNVDDIKTVLNYATTSSEAAAALSPHWQTISQFVYNQDKPWVVCGTSAGGHLAVAGVIENGIASGSWPNLVINLVGPMDLVNDNTNNSYSAEGFNDDFAPIVYRDLLIKYVNTLAKQQNASPRHKYITNTGSAGAYKTIIDNARTKWVFVSNNFDNLVPPETLYRFAYALPEEKRIIHNLDEELWKFLIDVNVDILRQADYNSTNYTGISHNTITVDIDYLKHNIQNMLGYNRNVLYPVTGTAELLGKTVTYSIASNILNLYTNDTSKNKARFDITSVVGTILPNTKIYFALNAESTVPVDQILINGNNWDTNSNNRFVTISNYKVGAFELTVKSAFTSYGKIKIDIFSDASLLNKVGSSYILYVNPEAFSLPNLTAGLCRTIYNGLPVTLKATSLDNLEILSQSVDTGVIDLTTTGELKTTVWSGYFVPNTTGIHTFKNSNVDDFIMWWIFKDAEYDVADEKSALMINTVDASTQTDSFVANNIRTMYLHANNRYRFRIHHFQATAGLSATFSWIPPGGVETTNFAGYIFHTSCSGRN